MNWIASISLLWRREKKETGWTENVKGTETGEIRQYFNSANFILGLAEEVRSAKVERKKTSRKVGRKMKVFASRTYDA